MTSYHIGLMNYENEDYTRVLLNDQENTNKHTLMIQTVHCWCHQPELKTTEYVYNIGNLTPVVKQFTYFYCYIGSDIDTLYIITQTL